MNQKGRSEGDNVPVTARAADLLNHYKFNKRSLSKKKDSIF